MVRYHDSLEGLTPDKLQGFFVGWPRPPSPETHLKLLRQSAHVILAVDDGTGAVVGFVNAISDGVLCAYIPLLEVLPAYQGRGIGSELVRRILERLADLYMIDVICDPDVQPFYERLGMRRATGMMQRNYQYQSGRRATE
jgi:GNAT superfamily N-acetyltransferase